MKKSRLWTCIVALGWLSVMGLSPVQAAEMEDNKTKDLVTPQVFQAAGPAPKDADGKTITEAIQSTVDAFRAALGNPNNGNAAGPLATGRREINWDGGGNNDMTQPLPPVTPFDVFFNTRGGRFTTPGTGLTQAPPEGGPQGGLAGLFNNPTYGDIFSTFSPLRLFTPVDSNITEAVFFVPSGTVTPPPTTLPPATVRGFGAVFTDVDQPDGIGPRQRHRHHRRASTLIEYYDVDDKLIFRGSVPASPGDGSLSFFGIVFEEAIIARVRITTGNVAPGPDDDEKNDIVMMDDFFYGEPQPRKE
jgi:hypothetical protein